MASAKYGPFRGGTIEDWRPQPLPLRQEEPALAA